MSAQPLGLLPLSGARWVTVRQHRRTLWTVLGVAVVSMGGLVAARLSYIRADPETHSLLRAAVDQADLAITLLPLLVALFVAGPLVAREMDSGAHRLAWSQSVTPAHWLAVKLALTAAVVVPGAALLGGVYRWSWTPIRQDMPLSIWEAQPYAALGITTMAYTLLATAVGALLGLLVQRTLVAMSLAGFATGSVLLALGQLRPHLWPQAMATGDGLDLEWFPGRDGIDTWWQESGQLTASGTRLRVEDCAGQGWSDQGVEQCLTGRGGVTDYVLHHPPSHFWPIQFVETAIVLALAAAVAFAAFRVLRRLHA
ncbi:ABC transporter permease [Streptomyces sp. NPDC127084]|uniref:ABC transporter permease n=1 Tax=Streptomyces sp. NPDC127084 TaxID=3347133 RepID=UPI00365D4090